jgi:hypothetical protein
MSERLSCPACKRVFGKDDLRGWLTLHGSNEWVDGFCPACDAPIQVKETVRRIWEARVVMEGE